MFALRRLVLGFALLLTAAAIHAQDIPDFIRHYSETIRTAAPALLEDEPVVAAASLADIYAQRGFAPAWDDAIRYRALVEVLQDAASHGLDPADYHAGVLARLTTADDARRGAVRDLLATDALMHFAAHLRVGKVDPVQLDPNWNLDRGRGDSLSATVLDRALAASSLIDFVNRELAPHDPSYDGLRAALGL